MNSMKYNTMKCHAMLCNAMQCNEMQRNDIEKGTPFRSFYATSLKLQIGKECATVCL